MEVSGDPVLHAISVDMGVVGLGASKIRLLGKLSPPRYCSAVHLMVRADQVKRINVQNSNPFFPKKAVPKVSRDAARISQEDAISDEEPITG